MIKLDDVNTSEGCLQHLLLAEASTPEQNGYDFNNIKTVLNAMKSVVMNRKALGKNYIFCSVDAKTIIDFICAPVSDKGCQAQQFKGFSKDSSGKVNIQIAILARIDDAVKIGNSSTHPRRAAFTAHINEVISISKTTVTDPYSTIPDIINSEAVLRGAYGWRTSGSSAPGGAYMKIPQVIPPQNHPDGDIQGIQFYTIKAVAAFLSEREYRRFFI